MEWRKGPPLWTRNRDQPKIKKMTRKKEISDKVWPAIILADPERYGGEGSLMVMVARVVLSKNT